MSEGEIPQWDVFNGGESLEDASDALIAGLTTRTKDLEKALTGKFIAIAVLQTHDDAGDPSGVPGERMTFLPAHRKWEVDLHNSSDTRPHTLRTLTNEEIEQEIGIVKSFLAPLSEKQTEREKAKAKKEEENGRQKSISR